MVVQQANLGFFSKSSGHGCGTGNCQSFWILGHRRSDKIYRVLCSIHFKAWLVGLKWCKSLFGWVVGIPTWCEGKTSDNVAEAFFRVHVLSLFVERKVGAKKTSRCIRNCFQPGAVPKDEQFRPAGLQTIVKGLLDQMLQVLPRYAYLVKLGIEFLCQLVRWSDRFCFQYWPRMTMTYQIIQAMFLFHSILQWGGLAPTFSNQWAWTLIYTIFGRKDKVSLEAMCEVTVQMNLKIAHASTWGSQSC